MAQDNSEDPSVDGIDPLELLAALDNLDAVEDKHNDGEDVQTVDPSELMEPLAADDVIGLDYDEEIPTKVEGKRVEQRRETFPPARNGTEDVFYLTDERRPSLTLTAEDHVSISDVLRAPPVPKMLAPLPPVHPPPRRDTILPPSTRTSSVSSIAPVAMPLEQDEPGPGPVPAPRVPGRGVYGSVVVVLAAAAAIIALWPSDNATKSVEHAQTIAQPPAAAVEKTTETNDVEPDPVTHQLNIVEIVSDAPLVAGVEEKAPPADKGIHPAPPSKVVIDDTAQPEHEDVSSTVDTEATGEEASSSVNEPQKLQPPEPPSADPLPFNRGAAAAALNGAAGMAQACRAEGMPQASARVSVTFAPSGRVTTAVVEGDRLSGSAEGSCIARTFRTLRVDPFSGPPVTVHKSFQF